MPSKSTRRHVYMPRVPHRRSSDYAPNELLDRYSDADINDEEDLEELSAAARRAADLKMDRRNRLEGAGRRAQRRTQGQGFVDDDDMDDGDEDEEMVSRMKKRTRRPYDERRDIDDMEGVEGVRDPYNLAPCLSHPGVQEIPLEQLSDIKAKSIVEWIATDLVRRSIIKHFRLFLTTYTDDRGDSVYGERIRALGESGFTCLLGLHNFMFSFGRQFRVIGSIIFPSLTVQAYSRLLPHQRSGCHAGNL